MKLIPSAKCCECVPDAASQPCVAVGSDAKETFALLCERHALEAFEHTAGANGTRFSMALRRANGLSVKSRSKR